VQSPVRSGERRWGWTAMNGRVSGVRVCKLEVAEEACGRVGGVLRCVGGEALAEYVA
jgi:hypothetical protein